MRISDWSSDVCSSDLALSVAGLPSDRFVFEGFLPAKSGARRARLAALAGEPRTLLFYESSHRIEDTLADCVAAFGADRAGVVARELTTLFETVLRPEERSVGTVCGRPLRSRWWPAH